jgi:hypothetical protein
MCEIDKGGNEFGSYLPSNHSCSSFLVFLYLVKVTLLKRPIREIEIGICPSYTLLLVCISRAKVCHFRQNVMSVGSHIPKNNTSLRFFTSYDAFPAFSRSWQKIYQVMFYIKPFVTSNTCLECMTTNVREMVVLGP